MCTGGDTGLEYNYAMDCYGVCFSNYVGICISAGSYNETVLDQEDCAGECDGDAVEDECGE